MIVAIGIDIDRTFIRFVAQAMTARLAVKVVNLRAAIEGDWRLDVPVRSPAIFKVAGESIDLRPDDAFFCRMIDLSSHETDCLKACRWRTLICGLQVWLTGVPGRVINRVTGCAHNGSKPLHEAVLTEMGFRVPESITTSDVDEVRRFVGEGPAISKTVCGVRADAMLVCEADFENFDSASGPVHLQRLVSGADLRVHVVGDGLIAQRLTTSAIDYRREGTFDDLEICVLPPSLRDLLITSSRDMGLVFTGWDFKVDHDGVYWCLEANPMPGYGSYDMRCDGLISEALLRHLTTADRTF